MYWSDDFDNVKLIALGIISSKGKTIDQLKKICAKIFAMTTFEHYIINYDVFRKHFNIKSVDIYWPK